MRLLGSPWSAQKSQPCSTSADFLGLQHDCSSAHLGKLSFWPRQALVDKVLHIVSVAEEAGLTPGAAAKLYGVLTFLETGTFGRIGRAGLSAVRDRQYEKGSEVTQSLTKSFALIKSLLVLHPKREFPLFGNESRVLVASDASYENGRGGAGFLLVIKPGQPEETRLVGCSPYLRRSIVYGEPTRPT